MSTDTHERLLLTTEQISKRTQLNKVTLWRMRERGDGPPFIRIGRRVRYPAIEFELWLRQRLEGGAGR